ncbi:MAG: hypothetical protein JWQ97_287, partial [Phenylobacterium sp.]|nr:hypothetical protein [Phenylobacterium sp.]
QTASSSLHGQNTMTIRNKAIGDVVGARLVAFSKAPTITYAKEGGVNEWEFHCGAIDTLLGSGAPAV